ncbi:filamentous hemagglutinin N-terminal domain-containing protein [Variovorax sp. VaC1]|uniref:two-partner secretion domain-containing protein n=1 Tax=Variovorax sp. VaC1 TaxID=3373132 RepID=UPI00374A331B
MRLHLRPRFISLAIAAACAVIGTPLWAQLAPGALPTGWSVTSGSVSIVRNGTTLNINQGTPQALVNFATFNVGADALVDIRQPGSTSALLARTIGGDPSLIYGQIKANGALWLINPAGIMVGPGARIDVGSFIASTLNVNDSDFLAGRLTFKAGATAGEIRNAGTITTASGGSIYMVAPSVTNTGTLTAPNGEILLAAGQSVQLMDTGTPGVSVAITGTAGEVKNLGRIAAEAGRIGLAAGLVSNGGSINADSVVREGGRVFLRASGDLKTTAASDISANGTTGGNVQLYADGAAAIDGRVSATGSAGRGGYVDTSGQRSLDVVNVPTVGKGGEWHIDPYSIEIVAGGGSGGTTGSNAISSNETSAYIGADVVTAQLDAGVNVSITTGRGNPATDIDQGNITVSSAIAKRGAIDSALTLNASNNIVINAPITSSASALTLNLNSNYQGDYPASPTTNHAVKLNAGMDLHGGVLTVSEGVIQNGNGTLDIASGTTTLGLPGSAINAATVNVASGATLAVGVAGSPVAPISGVLNNAGTVSVSGAGTAVFGQGGTHTGTFDVGSGTTLSLSGGHAFNAGAGFTGTGTVEWSGNVTLGTAVVFGASGNNNSLVLHASNIYGSAGGSLSTQGAPVVVDGQVVLQGATAWRNGAAIAVTGGGAINARSEGVYFENNGSITTSGTQSDVLAGSGAFISNFVNNGTLIKNSASDQQYTGMSNSNGSTVRVDAGTLTLQGVSLDGQVLVAGGTRLTLDSVNLNSHVAFAGAGTMAWKNYITLLGAVDIGASAPQLAIGEAATINGQGYALTTRNLVSVDAAQLDILDQTTWNNYGTVNLGAASPASLVFHGSGAFNNKAGAVLDLAAQSHVTLVAGSTITNDANATVRIAANASDAAPLFTAGDIGRLPNSGTVVKSGAGTAYVPLANLAGGTVQINEGELDARLGADNPNNGAIVLQAGTTLGSGGTHLYNNGSIAGSGAIALGGDATLFNNGTVSPGTAGATGTLAVQGNYTQGSSGVLNIRLGNDGFDLLDVGGSVNLGGTLNLGALGGFVPANGATADFVVTRGAYNSGAFAQVNAPPLASSSSTATLFVSYPSSGATVARALAVTAPTLSACTANAALPGCSAVLPTLSACTANAALPGCTAVLPTLASCTVNAALPGCSAVLPSAAMCAVSPSLAGCSAVASTPAVVPPPSADICTIAPNSALCQVLSPPTASSPVAPVQQAASEVVKTVVASLPTSDASSTSPDPKLKDKTATDADLVAKSEPKSGATPKKMYCN